MEVTHRRDRRRPVWHRRGRVRPVYGESMPASRPRSRPPAPVRPRGPLPARVYWVRRLIVLGVAVLLVVGLVRLFGGSGDAGSGEQAKAANASTKTSVDPTTAPTAAPTDVPAEGTTPAQGRRKRGKPVAPVAPVEPVLAEPTGVCESSDVVVTPVVPGAVAGTDVPITLNLRTVATPACTWSITPDTLTVTITSGSDPIWSSRQCPVAIPVQEVVVRQAVDAPVTLVWKEAKRSDDDCSAFAGWAGVGYYHVQAAALGGEPTDVQFELTRPVSAVITQTVTPKPQKADKPKRSGQPGGDTEHRSGDDGAGNDDGSAG